MTAERLHKLVGKRVRELRTAQKGLTQERLANEAELHPVFLSRVERGMTATTIDTIAIIGGALGITLAEFFAPFRQSLRLRGPRRVKRTRKV